MSDIRQSIPTCKCGKQWPHSFYWRCQRYYGSERPVQDPRARSHKAEIEVDIPPAPPKPSKKPKPAVNQPVSPAVQGTLL